LGIITKNEARAAADRAVRHVVKDAKAVLNEHKYIDKNSFDIFMSHSKMDEKIVLGAKQILEEKGFSVYVDWIEDPHLDRVSITKVTANYLRLRMSQCDLMFYLHSPNASLSKWCPWELGFFDSGFNKESKTFVFPVIDSGSSFEGQEYLGLYPIIDIDEIGKNNRRQVWRKSGDGYKSIPSILDAL